MIDFTKSYTARWKVVSIDEDTWDDGEALPGVTNFSINRDATDTVPLLETATMEVDSDIYGSFVEGWYRIVLLAEQKFIQERYDIATMLFQKTSGTNDHGRTTLSVKGTSVLRYAQDRKNIGSDYLYVPKRANGAQWVAELLGNVCKCPIMLEGDGFTLEEAVIFSPGITYLEMVWRVLAKGKWCMTVNGSGVVTIKERPTVPKLNITRKNPYGIQSSISKDFDYESVPNRYYAIDNTGRVEVVTNEDPNSILSYQNRGRWIDYVDTSPSRIDGESMYTYVRRRLKEESTLVEKRSYTREYFPDLVPFEMLSFALSEYDLDGEARILSQSITVGKGVQVKETVGFEHEEWRP